MTGGEFKVGICEKYAQYKPNHPPTHPSLPLSVHPLIHSSPYSSIHSSFPPLIRPSSKIMKRHLNFDVDGFSNRKNWKWCAFSLKAQLGSSRGAEFINLTSFHTKHFVIWNIYALSMSYGITIIIIVIIIIIIIIM